jgi:hypothetical protein
MLAETSLEIGLREKGKIRIGGAFRHHPDNILDRSVALQEDQEKPFARCSLGDRSLVVE